MVFIFFGWWVLGLALVFLTPIFAFLLPDRLLDHYLKQPWFNAGECILYRHFPGRVAFFVNVARSICFPKFGAKARPNMVDIHEQAPVWVKVSAWIFIVLLGGTFLCFLSLMVIELPTILHGGF